MPASPVASSQRHTWWWVFTLLIALPAIVLALLGLRAINADQMERQRQKRDQQAQLARLADGALANFVERMAGDLRTSTQDRPESPPVSLRGHPVFTIDRDGVLVFPRDRLYFGPAGRHPRAVQAIRVLAPSLNSTVDKAQTAEAQRRRGEAIAAYERAAADARLKPWAEFHLAAIAAASGDPHGLAALADLRWARPDALTPSGLPLALVAMNYSQQFSPAGRARFAPLIQRALANVRAGQWWLGAEQRRAYDRDLREWLRRTGATDPGEDTRLQELANVERLARQAWARDPIDIHPARFEHDEGSAALIIWSPTPESSEEWVGTAIFAPRLQRVLADALVPVVANAPATLRTTNGAQLWTNSTSTPSTSGVLDVRAVHGLQIGFGDGPDTASAIRAPGIFYGLVGLPVLLLAVGLVMTARVVRREIALSRMHGSFVAAVSHEFKSPIASIRLLMERLSTRRVDDMSAAPRYYATIAAELDRLEGLVNRLLESQRIQSGQKQYVLEPVCLTEMAESAVESARPRAEAKQITIEVQTAGTIPQLSLDRPAMSDAIRNLIDNAIKYSPPKTRVTIRVAATRQEVHLDVSDEGIGIAHEDLARIFDPFYRGRRGDLQSVQGTGLGLALVKAAVEAHAGTVDVWSDAGQGSRFRVRLPIPEHA